MEDTMKNIRAVIAALNKVTVCGKQNLTNLSGCIAVLEDVLIALQEASVNNEE